MRYIFWDLDGTILNTGVAGNSTYTAIAKSITGDATPFFRVSEKGKTDRYMCWQFFIYLYKRVPSLEELHDFCAYYEDVLCEKLQALNISILPQVDTILETLAKCEGYKNLLLTGNRRRGAFLKLSQYHLVDYFDFEQSIFGDDYNSKLDIALAQEALLGAQFPTERPTCYVIGDAIHDIRCGKKIGAKTIGVATGNTDLKALGEEEADLLFDELPPCEAFLKHLERLDKGANVLAR